MDKDSFIREHENFILTTASRYCRRYITKSDDEWAESLIAFDHAIDTFDESKGNFLTYARVVIEHRLTDYFRVQNRFTEEMDTEPGVFTGAAEDESEAGIALRQQIAYKSSVNDDNPLRDEIVALTEELLPYDISFAELVTCSPKAAKTKVICRRIILFMTGDEALMADFKRTGRLPGKKITESLKIPPKILERHRKYLMTAVLIASGDYPGLLGYLGLDEL